MSINLLKEIQQKLGYPPLQKIDANTQEVALDLSAPQEERFSQAALPAVLTALYKYSRADEGAKTILFDNLDIDWSDFIFDDNKDKVIEKIAAYSGLSAADVIPKLNSIAKEAILVVRGQVLSGSIFEVKNVLADSQNDVLTYLPASMQIGSLLHDNTIDDRTHKMEGPVSSLMHAIGGSFSGSDSDETNISK